jgi:hypothetical protein
MAQIRFVKHADIIDFIMKEILTGIEIETGIDVQPFLIGVVNGKSSVKLRSRLIGHGHIAAVAALA